MITSAAPDIERLRRVRAIFETGAGRTIRVAHGLSQDEFARRIGVSGRTLRRWELGQHRPQRATALLYFKALDELQAGAA